jgi:hypothetical protein
LKRSQRQARRTKKYMATAPSPPPMAKRTDITGIVPVPQEPGHLFQCLVFPWLMGLSCREMADHCPNSFY